MAQFIITYIGGTSPSTPEAAKKHMEDYRQWLTEYASVITSPANPFKDTHSIDSSGVVTRGSASALSGYTLLEVDTIEEAIEVAKACPFLNVGGSLDVAQLVKMH
ncbi:YciI family protein [Vibrio makurazakiensis]|uniref:YciI family protein n=1 Tax=Vibrio makurazakiensis TaxID=2910250 RepID=UPI003D0DD186